MGLPAHVYACSVSGSFETTLQSLYYCPLYQYSHWRWQKCLAPFGTKTDDPLAMFMTAVWMEAELRKYELKWMVHSSQLCTYDHCLLALLSDRNTCLDPALFFTLSGNYVAPYITALQQGDHCVVLLVPLETFMKRHSIGFSPSRA